MARARKAAIALLAACAGSDEKPQPAGPAPELAEYLNLTTGSDRRRRIIDSWKLSKAEWDRTVIETYRPLYDDYVAAFEAGKLSFDELFATRRSVVARAHFAGDQAATRGQAITRWALPTLAPTKVAELAGKPAIPIDAVFVDIGGNWRAIVGLDAIVRNRVSMLDAACATALDNIEPGGGKCIEAAFAVADATLRDDRTRLTHACGLAANLCGKPPGQ